jgi:hemolysin activation/secretion protein
MMRTHRIVYGSLIAVLLLPTIAFAQVRPPATTQPGQLQQRLRIEDERPSVGQESIISLPDEKGHNKALKQGVVFKLKALEIENNHVFSEKDLRQDYDTYLNHEVSLSTLNEIASKITVRYRNAGYILSRAVVPPQHIDNGVAKIRVIEGYVNKVLFEGDYKESGLLSSYANKIRNSKPLDAKTLERYLLLMEDLPGVTAHAVIRPAADAPGASDVVIQLSQRHLEGSATLNNRGTRFLGPVQAGVTADVDNVLGLYDRTQFHGVVTAEINELRYGQVTHEEQLDSEGTKLALSAGYTRTHPTYTLAAFDLQGRDTLYSAEISHPFIRSRQSNLYGNVQFDIHDTNVDALGSQLYNDHLRVARLGGSYDFVDRFAAVNKLDGTVSKGLNWGTDDGDIRSRASGRPDFTKGNIQVSRLQPIVGPFDLSVAGIGQLSADSLLIAEQMGLGGEAFGSAYDPSEITGDSGAAGRAELRYSRSGDFKYIPNYQLYTFYDIGKVWNRDSLPGVASSTSLADAGFGLRFNAQGSLSGSLEFAAPLTHPVAADGQDSDRARVFFALEYRY